MSDKFAFKDIGEEIHLIKRRLFISGFIITFLLSLIILRVFYLQVVMHEHFITLSEHNRVKILPILPIRGLIFSRDGVLLAENQPSFSLEIIPEKEKDLDAVINRVAKR